MAKIHILLDTRRALKEQNANGLPVYPLKISVYVTGKGQFMINTGVSVPEENWRNNTIVGLPKKDIYNNVLRTRLSKADDVLLKLDISGELSDMSINEIKQRVSQIVKNKEREQKESDKKILTVDEAFNINISSARRAGTKSVYSQTLSKIQCYYDVRTIPMREITLQWLRDFEQKMVADGLSINTIGIHMRTLRAVFNRAIDDELIGQECYPFRKFKIKAEKTRKRALTVEQLRTLRDYPCQEHQEKYRDIFMLMFYLLGINAVDLFGLKEIANGRIEYRRAKTARLYSIAVEPEAMQIINRYRGKEYLLDVCDVYGNYKDFLHRMNKNLQEIGPMELVANGAKDPRDVKKNKKQITALFPDLSSYWSRHTWATIAASLEVPKETIAAALGHGGSDVTDIYIDFDAKKVDEANRKVIDHISE